MQQLVDETLRGKVIVITEADRGIGAACARMLAANGAIVILGARNAKHLYELNRELAWDGFRAAVRCTHPAEYAQVEQLVCDAIARHGRVDAFVNNPYSTVVRKGMNIDWPQVVDTHITAYIHGIAAAQMHMSGHKAGHIVNVAPVFIPALDGVNDIAHRTVYSSLTRALQEITAGLQKCLSSHAMRCTLIDSAPVEGLSRSATDASEIELAVAESVARAVCFAIAQPAHTSIDQLVLRHIDKPCSDYSSTEHAVAQA